MKTTLDISDNVASQTRLLARREGVSFKALVEEGLRLVIEKHTMKPASPVKPVTFKGNGLTADFQTGSWDRIRDTIYEGHGK